MPKQKYTRDFVVNFLDNLGCELIGEYGGVKADITFKCKCKNIHVSNFDRFINGGMKGCKSCGAKRANKRNLLNYEQIAKEFIKHNCELLESEYINCKTKMQYKCENGHIAFITWSKFNQGKRCKKCATLKNSKKQRLNILDIANFFEINGCELLESEYINVRTKLKHICTCGSVVEKSWAAFKQSPACTCGFTYSKPVQSRYSKEDLIHYFWDYYKVYGRYPVAGDMKRNDSYPDISTYQRKFGSYKAFLKEINILSDDGWYLHDEQVLLEMYEDCKIEEIQERLIINKSKSTIQHKANKLGLKRSYESIYGIKEFTRNELIAELINFNKIHNRLPVSSDYADYEKSPSLTSFNRVFGKWSTALESAGFKSIHKPKSLTSDQLSDLKNMYEWGLDINEISLKFGYRNGASIYYHLRQLGYKKRRNEWDQQMIMYLSENYLTESWENLLENLYPFGQDEISSKAYRLNLKRDSSRYGKISRYKANNEDICLSYSELLITNFLIENNINYDKEVFYKDIVVDSRAGLMRCDWLIGDIVIEFFGMSGMTSYTEKINRKLDICKENGIIIIPLFPKDLNKNLEGVKAKLQQYDLI